MGRKLAATGCAVFVAALCAVPALAGEVKGPPGTPNEARTLAEVEAIRTGAPAHSQSICSYNGLNDMVLGQGPIDQITQNPHNQGTPGAAGAGAGGSGVPGSPTCGLGSNPENQ